MGWAAHSVKLSVEPELTDHLFFEQRSQTRVSSISTHTYYTQLTLGVRVIGAVGGSKSLPRSSQTDNSTGVIARSHRFMGELQTD